MTHSERRVLLGLMCGTSGDGIAGALVETSGYGTARTLTVHTHRTEPYPVGIRDRLFALFPPATFTAFALGALHRDLGEALAEFSTRMLDEAAVPTAKVDAVIMQAPTLVHHPPSASVPGFHLEVGDAAIVADRLQTTVVCDLRPSDIAVGGHGAPLSAFVDHALFSHPTLNRGLQNIGGIANVTHLPAGGDLDDTIAFDTGPGNMVIDAVVSRLTGGAKEFDQDGAWAAKGSVSGPLLQRCMGHPYVHRPLPKTSGREDFGAPFVDDVMEQAQRLGLSDADLVATVTAFTAECIRHHHDRDLVPRGGVDELILYGGGVHNRTLVRLITERLPGVRLRFHDDFGIPGDAREAVTWAVLGDEALAGNPANVPSASGATRHVVLGKIVRTRPGAQT